MQRLQLQLALTISYSPNVFFPGRWSNLKNLKLDIDVFKMFNITSYYVRTCICWEFASARSLCLASSTHRKEAKV